MAPAGDQPRREAGAGQHPTHGAADSAGADDHVSMVVSHRQFARLPSAWKLLLREVTDVPWEERGCTKAGLLRRLLVPRDQQPLKEARFLFATQVCSRLTTV